MMGNWIAATACGSAKINPACQQAERNLVSRYEKGMVSFLAPHLSRFWRDVATSSGSKSWISEEPCYAPVHALLR
jgi:hypothetical protein